jgi:hypothetical protein
MTEALWFRAMALVSSSDPPSATINCEMQGCLESEMRQAAMFVDSLRAGTITEMSFTRLKEIVFCPNL